MKGLILVSPTHDSGPDMKHRSVYPARRAAGIAAMLAPAMALLFERNSLDTGVQ